jgi:two-component system nitrate/nitrite response regulator NarL
LNAVAEGVRVYVVDDHAPFRQVLSHAFAAVPGVEIVGATGDVSECIREITALQPEVVLVDLHLPERAALAAVSAIRASCPTARILVLALSEVADQLSAALRAGADGYVVKNLEDAQLVSSVRRAFNGAAVLAATRADALQVGSAQPPVSLSPREREILRRVAQGGSNKEVARELGVAESTVKIHVQHILRKLKLASRVQAAVYAAQHGLLPRKA